MSSNNMYNILNTLKSLEPTPEQTVKAEAKRIYESVEAQGSITEGVSAVEAKLRQKFAEGVTEDVPTQAGGVDPKIQFLQPTIQFAEKLGYRVTLNPQGRVVAKLVNKQLGHTVHIGLFQPSSKGFEVSIANNLGWQTNAWSAKELARDFKGWHERAVKDQDFNNGYSEKPQLEQQGVAEGLRSEKVKMPNGQRPKGIGWVLKQAGEQSGKDYSVWERKFKLVDRQGVAEGQMSDDDIVNCIDDALEDGAPYEQAVMSACEECGCEPDYADQVYRANSPDSEHIPPVNFGDMDESAKPDFLDLDHDGNEKESMKKAAKDNVRVHKGTYGTSYDPSDEEKKTKTKHVPRTGQKGRPKKDVPMKASVPADPFGRTTGEVPKGKKGTKISGKGNIDTVNESMNFQALAKKHGMGMDECMNTLNDHYKKYQMTGECSDLLNGAMQLHRHHMEEGGPVPYEVPAVQRKAAGAAPLTPSSVQAQDAARSMHPPKLDAPKPAVHDELDELAKLAGITDEGAGIMHYKDEKAKEAGEDHFTLGGKTFPVKESDDELANIIHGHADAVEHFKQGGELDYDLESDLWDYYFNKGEIKNYDADASEFIARRFAEDLGIDEGNAFGLAVQQTPPGEEIKIDGKGTGEIKKENAALNELAKLAGLQVSEVTEGEDKCCCDDKGEENCPVHGHDHKDNLDEADAPVDEPEEEPENAPDEDYFSMKASTLNPGEGDNGEKAMHPDRPTFKNGDNALLKPANESVMKLEARLAKEYESIKKKA